MKDSPHDDSVASRELMRRCVQVTTGARLHFGLLDTTAPFGGIGVMVNAPQTEIAVFPHDSFDCQSSIRSRVMPIVERLVAHGGLPRPPACRVEAVQLSPAHSGLGSGTQLALAIAEAIGRFVGVSWDQATVAAVIAGRGKRSAVGVHGYFHGGLIYENAETPTDVNPLCRRIELPAQWRVVIVEPTQRSPQICGEAEREQFASLANQNRSGAGVESLHSILLEEILPSADAGDFNRFADAVQRYNRASGMLFAEVQGGPYNGSAVTSVVQQLIERGMTGVGQSSWGPGVFAWFDSQEKSQSFVAALPATMRLIAHAGPQNQPRSLSVSQHQ